MVQVLQGILLAREEGTILLGLQKVSEMPYVLIFADTL